MINEPRKIICLLSLALLSVFSGCSKCSSNTRTVFHSPNPNIEVLSPYKSVDWKCFQQYRANLHTHTTRSDGRYSPSEVINMYYEEGYSILAITDHDIVTWPWEKFGKSPEDVGMVAVKANEVSSFHHMGSYFCDYAEKDQNENISLRCLGKMEGLGVFFHPGRYDYPAEWYAYFFLTYNHLIGMEVVNQIDKYPGDREKWDMVLTLLMPKRNVWGFANDDMHHRFHFKAGWNIFLLPELTETHVRSAMENGVFYSCSGNSPPVINSIEVDNDKGFIRIRAKGHDEIIWVSSGRKVYEGKTVKFRKEPNICRYLRAEVSGKGGTTYTNPFAVVGKEDK